MTTEVPHLQSGDARFFVFMGVCGVGKSTVARAVAEALSGHFIEADSLHPPANIQAMSEGRPLTDAERWPWLEAVCRAALDTPPPVTIACSALKRAYRDLIRARLDRVLFVHLDGAADLIRARMQERRSHFMSHTMLDSQLAILETPDATETDCRRLEISGPQETVIAKAIEICRQHRAAGGRPDAATGTGSNPS